MIEIGDKVVCVDDRRYANHDTISHPNGRVVAGVVYSVAALLLTRKGNLKIAIVGFPVIMDGREQGWRSMRFCKFEDYKREQELEYYRSEPDRAPLRKKTVATDGGSAKPKQIDNPK